MNQNAEAIAILCSHLCVGDGVKPLEPREWSRLAQWLTAQGMEPKDLLAFNREDFCGAMHCTPEQADRMFRLIERSASLSFEVSRYESMGIRLVTRADADYPKRLKKKLGNACPPIFYYAGNLSLLNNTFTGYAGSRSIEAQDLTFTTETVRKTVERGFGVVSGGARGVDTAAETEALLQGGQAAVYLADSLMRKIKKKEVLQAVQDGRMVLLSPVKPDAGFRAGVAMARNRFIYGQSCGTVVVRSDQGKGGTWAGATECLKHQWCPVFCWNYPDYPGNAALIENGAVAIDSSWDGDILAASPPPPTEAETQITLFDT